MNGEFKGERRIGLLWHTFGHGNLGVDALARGHADIIRRSAARLGLKTTFVSLGFGQDLAAADLPPDVVVGPSPRVKPLLRGKSEFMAEIRRCDIVFDIGEGDSFTDIYGGRRYAYQIATKIAVLAAGKPLVIAPQTIGPFNNPVLRRVALAITGRARMVCTRDELSSAFLRDAHFSGEVNEFIDVAFALPYEPTIRRSDKMQIGISVSGLLYNQASGEGEFGLTIDYREFTHRLIEAFLARPDCEVHLIVHVAGSGGRDDDGPVAAALAGQYPALRLAPTFRTSVEAKSFISGMDFVVAARMHAAIAAFSSGVAVVPVAYSRKFNGLFGTLGYPYLVDGRKDDLDTATATVLDAFENRGDLQTAISRGLPEAKARLNAYERKIEDLLR